MGWWGGVGRKVRKLYLNNNKKFFKANSSYLSILNQLNPLEIEIEYLTLFLESRDHGKSIIANHGPAYTLLFISKL